MSHSLVSKNMFSRVLRDPYQRVKDQRVVVVGFRKCGLYPLDPTVIDSSGGSSKILMLLTHPKFPLPRSGVHLPPATPNPGP